MRRLPGERIQITELSRNRASRPPPKWSYRGPILNTNNYILLRKGGWWRGRPRGRDVGGMVGCEVCNGQVCVEVGQPLSETTRTGFTRSVELYSTGNWITSRHNVHRQITQASCELRAVRCPYGCRVRNICYHSRVYSLYL